MFGGDEFISGFAEWLESLVLGGQRVDKVLVSFLKCFDVIEWWLYRQAVKRTISQVRDKAWTRGKKEELNLRPSRQIPGRLRATTRQRRFDPPLCWIFASRNSVARNRPSPASLATRPAALRPTVGPFHALPWCWIIYSPAPSRNRN